MLHGEAFETLFLYTKFIKDVDEMEQIYNQLVPSCKKVLKILKPDIRDLHEQTSYNFLKKIHWIFKGCRTEIVSSLLHWRRCNVF